jgi:Zn-dependent protease with chaperone function
MIPAPRAPADLERVLPAPMPQLRVWASGVAGRNLRGTAAGIFAAWFNLPFIVLMAGLGAIVGGLGGVVSGTFAGEGVLARLNALLKWVFPLPVSVQQLLPTAALQIGGIIGGILGALNGGLTLAWDAFTWPWQLLYADDPTWPWAVAIGQVVTGLVVGFGFVVWSSATEGVRLRIRGARHPSRREAEWLGPIMADTAARLVIKGLPRLLIDDRREVNAIAGIRHLVIYRGLLDDTQYNRRELAGVIGHELWHWHRGDAIAMAWAKGVALPLYLMYSLATALLRVARVRPLQVVIRILLWSVLVCVDYFVIPVQASVWRAREYEADAAVAAAGLGDGLRTVLSRIHTSFDGARDGWDAAINATHPPNELRLERLERPGRRYVVGEDAGAGVSAAVIGAGRTSTIRRD